MKTETQSGVVHFSIGDEFGIRLMEIAQEHLTEGNDPVKALKTLTDSLQGCSTEMAVKILKGDIVLIVDTEDQTVIPTERIPDIHDRLFPKVDVMYWMESRAADVERYAGCLNDGFNGVQGLIRRNRGMYSVEFHFEDLIKFIAGNNESVLSELQKDERISQIQHLFHSSKGFIERSMKIMSIMDWMLNSWGDFDEFLNRERYIILKSRCSEALTLIMIKLQETMNLQFSMEEIQDDDITKYIEAAVEIEKTISKGIEPVNILDNYSAGWLSPEGDYYALNGEIANMLHIQISDALQEAGIIPADDEKGREINPDVWLEMAGWVRIHENNIQFAGCLNYKSERANVDLTTKQIEKIYNYGQRCWGSILKMGWKRELMSAALFEMMAQNNLPELYKRYFEF